MAEDTLEFGVREWAQRHQQRLHACGLSDHYRQIFELTRLDDAIAIHDDEAGVLAAAQVAAMAARFVVDDAEVDKNVVCVDRKRQWNRFGNARHNAVLHTLTSPLRRRRRRTADA